jgi:hypothetical protein
VWQIAQRVGIVNKGNSPKFWSTAVRRIIPLFFLLLLFIATILFNRGETDQAAITAAPAAIDAPSSTQTAAGTPTPAVTATAVSSPTPTTTPTPYPMPDPNFTIQLLGPPPGSSFFTATPINFYWSWPAPLLADQEFFLLLKSETTEQRLGPVNLANLGEVYQVSLSNLPAGEHRWTVTLMSQNLGTEISRSETRIINALTR